MKKIVSLFMVLAMVLGITVVSVSAQEAEIKAENVLHFDANTAVHWDKAFEKVYCHIWEIEGDMFYAWQTKREKCTDEDHDGVWTYDLDANGIVLEDGKVYGCIFSNEHGKQTCNLLFDKTVLGDTAYCDGEYYDSPESIKYYYVFWKNQGNGLHDFGPQLDITSLGEVVGTCIPNTTTALELFETFLTNRLDNARVYSGKNDQSIIDDIAVRLELTISDVVTALQNTGVDAKWLWYSSTAQMGDYKPIIGDADGDSRLSILDATAIQRHLAKMSVLPDIAKKYADADKNNEITVLDATKIQFVLAKKPDVI